MKSPLNLDEAGKFLEGVASKISTGEANLAPQDLQNIESEGSNSPQLEQSKSQSPSPMEGV